MGDKKSGLEENYMAAKTIMGGGKYFGRQKNHGRRKILGQTKKDNSRKMIWQTMKL
jgi:hypothetical protein